MRDSIPKKFLSNQLNITDPKIIENKFENRERNFTIKNLSNNTFSKDLKGKTSLGFFLTNVKINENLKNSNEEILKSESKLKENYLIERKKESSLKLKKEPFMLHIDSRPKRSHFYLDILEKKKAEKSSKDLKENNLLKFDLKKDNLLTTLIRKKNQEIMDGIKKRNISIDKINNFIGSRTMSNFNKKLQITIGEKNSSKNKNKNLDLEKFQTINSNSSLQKSIPPTFSKRNSDSDQESGTDNGIPDTTKKEQISNIKMQAKTFTNGFKISNKSNTHQSSIPLILNKANHIIKDNLKQALANSVTIKNDLTSLYSLEQNTIDMRYNLLKKHEELLNKEHDNDFIKEKEELKNRVRNNVKGIFNPDAGEMVYIDENKANILNHIDTVLKMRTENFYKFRGVCVEKYVHYAKKNDIFEYVFSNKRYFPKKNYRKIDDNTLKLKRLYFNIKTTDMNIKKIFDDRKKNSKINNY